MTKFYKDVQEYHLHSPASVDQSRWVFLPFPIAKNRLKRLTFFRMPM